MTLTPDNFPVVMNDHLRELWRQYPDEKVRCLILEVHRAREVARRCHTDTQAAAMALGRGEHGEAHAQIKRATERLFNEQVRLGFVGGIPVQVRILQ